VQKDMSSNINSLLIRIPCCLLTEHPVGPLSGWSMSARRRQERTPLNQVLVERSTPSPTFTRCPMLLGDEDAQGQSLAGDAHPVDGITGHLPSERRRKPNADASTTCFGLSEGFGPIRRPFVLRDPALLGILAHPGLLVSTCPSWIGRDTCLRARDRGAARSWNTGAQ